MKIYTDTSVFGGVFDDEFRDVSETFFRQVKKGDFILCVSEVVCREIEAAPAKIRRYFASMENHFTVFPVDEECLELRQKYLEKKIVGPRYLDDALHVAVASASGCDMIVSWNFRHIVHYDKITLYNAVNRVNGYRELFINSPAEVIFYEE